MGPDCSKYQERRELFTNEIPEKYKYQERRELFSSFERVAYLDGFYHGAMNIGRNGRTTFTPAQATGGFGKFIIDIIGWMYHDATSIGIVIETLFHAEQAK